MNPVHLNLYIVDDDEAVRTGLGSQFIARGYSVRAFKSGELFLTAVSAASEGVVILDLRMDPGMGGIAVFNVLRAMSCPLMVLFLSGHGTIPQAVQAVKDGAFGWLPKPCDETELLEQVERAMQAATAGSLTLGLSVTRARLSRDMYLRATAHSSLVSSMSAPTNRMIAASLGKIPMTSARRLISRLTRSSGFVDAICAQCSRGKVM